MLRKQVARLEPMPEQDLESGLEGNQRPGSKLMLTMQKLYFGLVLSWLTQAFWVC